MTETTRQKTNKDSKVMQVFFRGEDVHLHAQYKALAASNDMTLQDMTMKLIKDALDKS